MRGRPPINLPPDARKRAVASIRQYFAAEMDQEIGDLKAGLLLDYWPFGCRLTRIRCSLTTPRRSVPGRHLAR